MKVGPSFGFEFFPMRWRLKPISRGKSKLEEGKAKKRSESNHLTMGFDFRNKSIPAIIKISGI